MSDTREWGSFWSMSFNMTNVWTINIIIPIFIIIAHTQTHKHNSIWCKQILRTQTKLIGERRREKTTNYEMYLEYRNCLACLHTSSHLPLSCCSIFKSIDHAYFLLYEWKGTFARLIPIYHIWWVAMLCYDMVQLHAHHHVNRQKRNMLINEKAMSRAHQYILCELCSLH